MPGAGQQHAPAGVVHAAGSALESGTCSTSLVFTRKTRELIGIVPATKSGYASIFHAEAVVLGLGRHLSIGGIFNQSPLQAVVAG